MVEFNVGNILKMPQILKIPELVNLTDILLSHIWASLHRWQFWSIALKLFLHNNCNTVYHLFYPACTSVTLTVEL